jgi:hypothetical protein
LLPSPWSSGCNLNCQAVAVVKHGLMLSACIVLWRAYGMYSGLERSRYCVTFVNSDQGIFLPEGFFVSEDKMSAEVDRVFRPWSDMYIHC